MMSTFLKTYIFTNNVYTKQFENDSLRNFRKLMATKEIQPTMYNNLKLQ